MSTSSKRFHRIIHSSNRRRGGGAAALIAIPVEDSFTDDDGVELPDHTPNVSPAPWVFQEAYDGNTGTIDIQSNRAECQDAVVNIATIDSGISDCDITTIIRYPAIVTTSTDGVVLRYEDENNYWFIGPVTSQNKFRIIKREGGSNTVEDFATVTISALTNYTITVNADGGAIVAELNDANQLTATDSFTTTETKHGISGFVEGDQKPQFDNFEVARL